MNKKQYWEQTKHTFDDVICNMPACECLVNGIFRKVLNINIEIKYGVLIHVPCVRSHPIIAHSNVNKQFRHWKKTWIFKSTFWIFHFLAWIFNRTTKYSFPPSARIWCSICANFIKIRSAVFAKPCTQNYFLKLKFC